MLPCKAVSFAFVLAATCLAAVYWLRPLIVIVRVPSSGTMEGPPPFVMLTCPPSSRSPEPDAEGDCECRTSVGKKCYEQMPSGRWKRGCSGSPSFSFRSSTYFPVTCRTCECLVVAEIHDRGSHVLIDTAREVRIMRQGAVVSQRQSRRVQSYNYSFRNNFHKEFVVIASSPRSPVVEQLVFARKNELCGIGTFTRDRLVCSKLGARGGKTIADAVAADLGATTAPIPIERGFGLEFEFVARPIPDDVRHRLKQQVMGSFQYWLGRHMFNSLMGIAAYAAGQRNSSGVADLLGNMSDFDAVIDQLAEVDLPGFEECFVNTTKSPDIIDKPCSQNTDCALTQYCMDCRACSAFKEAVLRGQYVGTSPGRLRAGGIDPFLCNGCRSRAATVCKPRTLCRDGFPVGGTTCLTPLKTWTWKFDPSVAPLRADEARALGMGEREGDGAGFEVVSPPISGPEGARAAAEVLTVLRGMGIQAGSSSGLHVHVNVASEKVPGKVLSPRQIANLWVAFARFQLVIDEMLSPGRPGNPYAQRLFLPDNWDSQRLDDCDSYGGCAGERSCHCTKRFFRQIHGYVNRPHRSNITEFCNAVLASPTTPYPCNERFPDQRYYALNLVPLGRLGTVEFRAHSATYDSERVLRWAQFAVAFVEHFGAGAPHAASPYLDVPVEKGLKALTQAQRMATAEDLFSALEGKINPGTRLFYGTRKWEANAPGCDVATPPIASDAARASFQNTTALMRSMGRQVVVTKSPDPDGDE